MQRASGIKNRVGENSDRPTTGHGGYRIIFTVSLPLVISTGTTMVMTFTDRVFLSNYSLDAISAALPAGLAAFLFMAFFLGTAEYVNVFVAQYTGAGAPGRIGAALWQGIYFSILAGLAMTLISVSAGPLFGLVGHAPRVQDLEVTYFRALCLGSPFGIAAAALSCFYSGRGLTVPVMAAHLAGTLVNIPLDYALINGCWGLPELGILGAAIATVTAWAVVGLLFAVAIFNRSNNRIFRVLTDYRFEKPLFLRLVKFGVPGSVQFCLDIFAFTVFLFMVGRIGKTELAATNIVISLNSLAFMPMMGFSMGTSTLVGQALGRNAPDEAILLVRRTIHIVYCYIFSMMGVYLVFPRPLLALFQPRAMPLSEFGTIVQTGRMLLCFVAFYIFFDGPYMIFTGALKGAGDTRFIMWSVGLASVFVLVVPVYVVVEFFGAGIHAAWTLLTLFILTLFALTGWRYRQKKWTGMRVIEKQPEKK